MGQIKSIGTTQIRDDNTSSNSTNNSKSNKKNGNNNNSNSYSYNYNDTDNKGSWGMPHAGLGHPGDKEHNRDLGGDLLRIYEGKLRDNSC